MILLKGFLIITTIFIHITFILTVCAVVIDMPNNIEEAEDGKKITFNTICKSIKSLKKENYIDALYNIIACYILILFLGLVSYIGISIIGFIIKL